jgi:hypothetical protein
MHGGLIQSLSLVDASGFAIIAAILVLLAGGVLVTVALRARYAAIARDLARHAGSGTRFDSAVLNRIVADAQRAQLHGPRFVNVQAIIDQGFQAELRWLLIGERFVKSSTGLMIILGLVGTFYGLTLSIGKLAALVSGDVGGSADFTETLTDGLTRALSGMSVAFSTSLFGILAAIVMTLLGVFANASDRRLQLMVEIETFLDNLLQAGPAGTGAATGQAAGVGADAAERLDRAVDALGRSISELHGAVGQFEAALQAFSSTTRDFREFNLHLKDNVQRMSLGFGDLGETLKEHVRELKAHGQSGGRP